MGDWWRSLTLPQVLLIIFGVLVLLALLFCASVFLFIPVRTGSSPALP